MNAPPPSGPVFLSRRGSILASAPPVPEYLVEHFKRSAGGHGTYTAMCIAENRLVWDLLEARFAAPLSIPHDAVCYDQMTGSLRFRRQLASFMGPWILGREVDPAHIAVLAGAGSVLEILFYALGDPGDTILVPTPSYAGFWLDIGTRDQLTVQPVHCHAADGFRLTPELLDRALAAAHSPVRALLFTSPNNPLGRVYSAVEVTGILQWAENAGIHVVFDEIYALSVFGDRPFISCAALRPRLGDTVHIVWAFSKDFGASGLRCGVLVSENQELMAAVDALSYWACCSGDTQYRLGEMIADDAWVGEYIAQMKGRLADAYHRASGALSEEGIPHLASKAGFFLLCDMRSFMPAPSWEAEHKLWRCLNESAGANLTPGAACHNAEPGFLRLCFANVPPDEVEAAIHRMGPVLRGLRS